MTSNVKDTALQFTLREINVQIKSKTFLIWLAVAIVLLTIAGPFDTYEAFNFLERLAYWGLIAPTTYLAASFTATYFTVLLIRKGMKHWPSHIIAGIIAGLPVGLVVWAFGIILEDGHNFVMSSAFEVILISIGITLPVTLLFGYYGHLETQQVENHETDVGIENFFARLPKRLGRDLICLHAQDHYVKVETTLGSELILTLTSSQL